MSQPMRQLRKTVQVPGRPYFMTVYENGDGFFSRDGTPRTAAPLTELEPLPEDRTGLWVDYRAGANLSFRSFANGMTFTNIPWEAAA